MPDTKPILESSKNIKKENYLKLTPKHIIFKPQKIKYEKENLKEILKGGWGAVGKLNYR